MGPFFYLVSSSLKSFDMKKSLLYFCLCFNLFVGLASLNGQSKNPPAPGFNEAGSDPKAIAIADQVMEAMGGRKAWDATRYIQWNFFGRRLLIWDKKAGMVRIEIPADSTIYLLDINKETGKVMRKGQEYTQVDSLKKFLTMAKSIWINDSYWLIMPFKLKDSGLTIKYKGEMNTQAGQPADVLELTFANVGRTPDNKYLVFVDKTSHLVTQWHYFAKYTDPNPTIMTPWENYQTFGKVKLSPDRGGNRKMTDVKVWDKVPTSAFTDFAKPKM
jgi:hypothetical protein